MKLRKMNIDDYEEVVDIPKFIKELYSNRNNKKVGLFECPECNNEFETIIANVKQGVTKRCRLCI